MQKTVEIPLLQLCIKVVDMPVDVHCPLLVLKCRQLRRSPQLQFMARRDEFLGPCTQVHGQGEGVAGTPGVNLPGVLPPELKCTHVTSIARDTLSSHPVRTTTTNTTNTTLCSHFGSSRIDILPDFGPAWPVSCERFFQAGSFIRDLLGLCVLLRNVEAPCDQVGG